MMQKNDLTHGNAFKTLLRFSLRFLLSYFLQTLYGMADLLIVGQFNGVECTTAVSIGSQVICNMKKAAGKFLSCQRLLCLQGVYDFCFDDLFDSAADAVHLASPCHGLFSFRACSFPKVSQTEISLYCSPSFNIDQFSTQTPFSE